MADWIILKRTGTGPLDLKPTAIIPNKLATEALAAAAEGYAGDGDYVALRWDSRADLIGSCTPKMEPRTP